MSKRKRPQPEWMRVVHECDYAKCKAPYTKVKKNQRFCSGQCRLRDWLATNPRVSLPVTRLADGRLQVTLEIQDPGFLATLKPQGGTAPGVARGEKVA